MNGLFTTLESPVPTKYCIIFMISSLIALILILIALPIFMWAIFTQKYQLATSLGILIPTYLYMYIRDRLLYNVCVKN